jgi:integrase
MSIKKRKWRTPKTGEERESWIVDYVDQYGKRHIKTFKTNKAALAWATEAHYEVKQGVHTPATASITVAEAAELWIAHGEAEGLEYSTIQGRRDHLNKHIAPFIGREKLSSLTVPRVYDFDARLRDNGRSVAMRRKVMTSLKSILSHAQRQGRVAQNVARGVSVKADRRNHTGPLQAGVDFPTLAELRQLIDGAPDKWRPLIATAIFTGMRVSELLGLRWSDVDLEGELPVIRVRQRADRRGNIGSPKSRAGSRDIPLPPFVVNTLRQWRVACPTSEFNLVFLAAGGGIKNYFTLRSSAWLPLLTKLGLPQYGFHSLRHAAASMFIAHLGWTPKRIQTVLGHASITMTYDRYGHLFEDRDNDKEAMKKLEAVVIAA